MNRPITFPAQATETIAPLPTTPQWRRTRCHSSDPYVVGLNEEWSRLAGGQELEPDVLSLLDQARRHHAHMSVIGDLDDLVAAMHRHGDVPLLFALETAQAGSYVAARAVIQTMLPKLSRLSHSVREGRDFGSVMAEAVAAMYEVIYRYPRDRRPRSVAANLALDTLKSLRSALGPELPASAALPTLVTATQARPNRYFSAAPPMVTGSGELATALTDARLEGIVELSGCEAALARCHRRLPGGGGAKPLHHPCGAAPALPPRLRHDPHPRRAARRLTSCRIGFAASAGTAIKSTITPLRRLNAGTPGDAPTGYLARSPLVSCPCRQEPRQEHARTPVTFEQYLRCHARPCSCWSANTGDRAETEPHRALSSRHNNLTDRSRRHLPSLASTPLVFVAASA